MHRSLPRKTNIWHCCIFSLFSDSIIHPVIAHAQRESKFPAQQILKRILWVVIEESIYSVCRLRDLFTVGKKLFGHHRLIDRKGFWLQPSCTICDKNERNCCWWIGVCIQDIEWLIGKLNIHRLDNSIKWRIFRCDPGVKAKTLHNMSFYES